MAEAAVRKAPLTVLTVHSVPASYWSGHPVTMPGDEDEVTRIRQAAESAGAACAAKLGASEPESVNRDRSERIPGPALIDAAKDSDLLVVGTRGGGGFGLLLMGSVSSQVMHHASCPVVVAPADR